MTLGAEQSLILIEAEPHGAELLARVEGLLASGAETAEAPLVPRLLGESSAADALAAWSPADPPPAVVLIGPHVERALALARRVYRAAGTVQIVFLAEAERATRLRREMSLAPMIGNYRIAPRVDENLGRMLRDAARLGQQRRQVRTTLDRINLGRVASPPADSLDFRKLAISDRYLVGVLQQAQDAILALDEAGRTVTLNHTAEVLFDVPAAEANGRSLAALVEGEAAVLLSSILETVRSGASEARAEISRVRRDGSAVDLDVSVAPVRGEQGERMGFLAIAREVTERRQAEAERAALLAREQEARAQAEAANRAKDEFLATVSHELRTPLNAILGWARLLRTGRLDPETFERAVASVERNAQAQAQLIDDLLDISRIITGKLRLNVQSVELPGVIEAAVDAIRPAAQAKDIRLQILLDSNLGPVLGDPQRLQQVVWNLVSNAVKFTPKGGRVRVTLERIHSHAEIVVCDSGPGIGPEFLPYVFERFRQADPTITRAHGGLGLGLAIVRQLVELHGGQVEAQSDGEGRGATFTVKLPLIATRREAASRIHSAARESVPFECSGSLDGVKLLLVDDETDTLEVLTFLLTDCGAEVRTADSASSALRALAEWRPDLLVSDIGMPGEDGYSLLKKIRALDTEWARKLPAVALTAYARPEDRVRMLSSGFQAHLAKPADPSELIAVILSQTRAVTR